MRSPRRWILVGFLVVVLGIVPIFPTTIRIVVALLGAAIALVAISRVLRRQAGVRDLGRVGPKTGQGDADLHEVMRRD
jgi:type III secretory pathway component EscV